RWRHHPTQRRLSGDRAFRQQNHVHRHARPRRIQRYACARCQGHRYRRTRGRRRRRRHAADRRGDKSRQGGESADDHRDQQDRPARREAGTGAHRIAQHEIQVESLGGQVPHGEVSAAKELNIDRLLETIALQSEILDLKANPNRPAEGTVIEAKLDRGRGPVATVLVQRGTLRGGDLVVAGAEWGRVRALVSDAGTAVEDAAPSTPVEVLGFNGTPEASDRLAVVQSEARAREVTAYRARQRRDKMAARATGMRGSLEQMMSQLK